MSAALRDLLGEHHVEVPTDNDFQRRARLLQALWRESQGYAIGTHRSRPLGSRLAMPDAERLLSNYVTDAIRDVVRREVQDPARSRGKLFARPRIFCDLLSSQPLCFNLFGELQGDLDLASRALSALSGGRIARVTAIEFEHSPGRGDARYTGDRSAFDVFVEYVDARRDRGFIGIEVKYHEDLKDPPAPHRTRYDEVTAAMGAFRDGAMDRLRARPLQQVWRDHMLAGSLALDTTEGYADGFFAMLYPAGNVHCQRAVDRYRACLRSSASFAAWTLEGFVGALHAAGGGAWVREVEQRYLSFARLPRE